MVLHYPYRGYTTTLPQFKKQILHLCLLPSSVYWYKYTDVQDAYTNTIFSLEMVEKLCIFLHKNIVFNPLNPELNLICYLLALLGAHHFLHVSRIRVKLLTLRRLMSYIYMEHPFLMFLDHTQRRSTVGRTPLDE